jgi:hypothetical protein
MAIMIKIGKIDIQVRSVIMNFLGVSLRARQKRKVFILIFLVALPLVFLIWAGLFVSLAFCLSAGLAGLYLLLVPFFSSTNNRPHVDYFAIFLFLIGLVSVFACGSYFRWLRRSFNSGVIFFEQLLPIAGAILWLFGLIGVIIWLVSAV